VAYHVVPIEETFEQYLKMLRPVFDDTPMGTAEENIQARIRGNILMRSRINSARSYFRPATKAKSA